MTSGVSKQATSRTIIFTSIYLEDRSQPLYAALYGRYHRLYSCTPVHRGSPGELNPCLQPGSDISACCLSGRDCSTGLFKQCMDMLRPGWRYMKRQLPVVDADKMRAEDRVSEYEAAESKIVDLHVKSGKIIFCPERTRNEKDPVSGQIRYEYQVAVVGREVGVDSCAMLREFKCWQETYRGVGD